MPRRLPSLTLIWICGRAGDGGRIKWGAQVRANTGQGWRMDSSGLVSRLLNGSGGTCEREGGVRGRGTPSGGERERIARRERCGRGGFRER